MSNDEHRPEPCERCGGTAPLTDSPRDELYFHAARLSIIFENGRAVRMVYGEPSPPPRGRLCEVCTRDFSEWLKAPRRRRKIPVTPEIHERLLNGDYLRAGGNAKCERCERTYNEHNVLDTPNGGWWAVACDGRILKL